MKKLFFLIFCVSYINPLLSQNNSLYQTGVAAEQNLKDIGNLSPYSAAGDGFDTRYQGVKGSTRLYDTLLPSYLMVDGIEKYMKIDADLDLISNSIVFKNTRTGKLLSLPSENVPILKLLLSCFIIIQYCLQTPFSCMPIP